MGLILISFLYVVRGLHLIEKKSDLPNYLKLLLASPPIPWTIHLVIVFYLQTYLQGDGMESSYKVLNTNYLQLLQFLLGLPIWYGLLSLATFATPTGYPLVWFQVREYPRWRGGHEPVPQLSRGQEDGGGERVHQRTPKQRHGETGCEAGLYSISFHCCP